MRLLRLGPPAMALALVAALASACGSGDSGPDLGPLASALGSGDFSGVSFAGGQSADDVSQQYAQIVDGLGVTPSVSVGDPQISGATATVPVTWTWPLADGGWTYQTTATAEHAGGQWLVDWSPAIVQPKLGKGDVLRTVSVAPRRGDIIGAHGIHLVTDRPVVEFGIDRSKLKSTAAAVSSAKRLAALLDLDVAGYAARVKASGTEQFVEAITYREDQAPSVAAKLDDIPGAVALKTELPLAPTKTFAAALLGTVGPVTADLIKKDPQTYHVGDIVGLSGLEARYDDQLRGSPGSAVEVVTPDGGTTVVHKIAPATGRPLRISLDERLQNIAETLLQNVKPASALVALRPSTGQILAAANGPGAGAADLATYGQAPPGSTFKTFDSLALIRQGMTPDSTVTCSPKAVVDGKAFHNDSWYPSSALGKVPLKLAVAQSCNTAMVNARGKLGDVASAAASLGFGIDHDTGFPAYFGQLPKPATETERAADLIGQGKVLASPMVMAAAIGSIEAGKTVVPTLVDGVKATVPDGVAPITPAEDAALKTIFRTVVTSGTGSNLLDVPGPPVIAKTGTAEFDRNGQRLTHTWMIAAQGDLAVAVYVDVGDTGSGTSGPILESFLRAARQG